MKKRKCASLLILISSNLYNIECLGRSFRRKWQMEIATDNLEIATDNLDNMAFIPHLFLL